VPRARLDCGRVASYTKLLKTGCLPAVFDIETVNEQLAELTDELLGDSKPAEPAN
jgi:hypothetical protein